jgi:hypothetical protein
VDTSSLPKELCFSIATAVTYIYTRRGERNCFFAYKLNKRSSHYNCDALPLRQTGMLWDRRNYRHSVGYMKLSCSRLSSSYRWTTLSQHVCPAHSNHMSRLEVCLVAERKLMVWFRVFEKCLVTEAPIFERYFECIMNARCQSQ